MQIQYMLTTFDNPFDPFEQFTSWFLFDNEHGYNTCGKLGRIINLSEGLSDVEVMRETELAIDKIIEYDFTNTYRKIKQGDISQ